MIMDSESCNNNEEEVLSEKPTDIIGRLEGKRSNAGEILPLLKLLVPNSTAGALIGKGGANITEMQNKFGGSIHLSPNGQCYPGTSERIVIINGDISQIIDLNNHIMEKIHVGLSESEGKRLSDEGRSQQVKVILTNGAAGLLIGRGGVTIKAIQEETKAKITINHREDSNVPGERVLTMLGSMEQRMDACRHVIEKIANEDSNMRNSHFKYSNNNVDMNLNQGSIANLRLLFNTQEDNNVFTALSNHPIAGRGDSVGNLGMSSLFNQGGRGKFKTSVQIQVEVPDILVGAILGKQGQTILEFIQYSGANIKFSEKNEFVQGTTNRVLTISGDIKQTETAYFLISQKIEQVQGELYGQY